MKAELKAHQEYLPVVASQFEEDAGQGFENADSESYAIPFLIILQSGSPQCKKSEGAYIKGAEEGFLFNTVTQELIDGNVGVLILPAYYQREFLEWVPRDSGGGGLVGHYAPSDPIVETVDKATSKLPNGNMLQDTRNHYALIVKEDGTYTPAVISMVSTQVKKSRQWMSKMDGIKMKRANGSLFTPPMFSHLYKITTVAESNDKGSWFGWKIELVGAVTNSDHYAAAKAFREAISSGAAKLSNPDPDQGYYAGKDDDTTQF